MKTFLILILVVFVLVVLLYILDRLLGITKVVNDQLDTETDVYNNDACIFLDGDLYNKRLFTDENESITRDMIEKNERDVGKGIKLQPGKHYTVKCSECNKYLYKDDKGKCTPYAYDGRYTASNSLGVCTAIGYAKPCDQVAKILQ